MVELRGIIDIQFLAFAVNGSNSPEDGVQFQISGGRGSQADASKWRSTPTTEWPRAFRSFAKCGPI
jgi:hypothetical protein